MIYRRIAIMILSAKKDIVNFSYSQRIYIDGRIYDAR